MKKIFCDGCGDEINRVEDGALKAISTSHDLGYKCHDNTYRRFTVRVVIEPVRVNGEHIDLCGACSWYLVDRMDPRPNDERIQPRVSPEPAGSFD